MLGARPTPALITGWLPAGSAPLANGSLWERGSRRRADIPNTHSGLTPKALPSWTPASRDRSHLSAQRPTFSAPRPLAPSAPAPLPWLCGAKTLQRPGAVGLGPPRGRRSGCKWECKRWTRAAAGELPLQPGRASWHLVLGSSYRVRFAHGPGSHQRGNSLDTAAAGPAPYTYPGRRGARAVHIPRPASGIHGGESLSSF